MPDCSSNVFFNVTGNYNNAFAATSSGAQVTTPIFLSDAQSIIVSNLTTSISATSSKIATIDVSLALLKSQVLALNNLDFTSIDVSFVTHNELDSSLSNVYTKSLIDASFVLKTKFDASINNVYTKSLIDASFVLKTTFDASINNIYTKTQIDASFQNVITRSNLDTSLNNYVRTSNLQNNTFNAALNTLDVTGVLNATNLFLSGDLIVNGAINTINSNHIDISDLVIQVASNLIDKTHLIYNQAGLDVSNIASLKYNGTKWTVLGGDLHVGDNKVVLDASLDNYALTTSLADYALDASLSSYALNSSLASYELDASINNLDISQNLKVNNYSINTLINKFNAFVQAISDHSKDLHKIQDEILTYKITN